ncbi:MAG: iron-sulfur cluster assembly scaffold protein [Thermoplasmata archaeon]
MSNDEYGEGAKELDTIVENITKILELQDLRTFSKEVVAEFKNPTHAARMPDADAEGIADGLCGDTMEMYLKIEGERIKACRFYTDGCGATIACGNRLARFVEGMSLQAARSVNPSDLISLLNGLPHEHVHCATLAVMALRNAIRNFEEKRTGCRGEGV